MTQRIDKERPTSPVQRPKAAHKKPVKKNYATPSLLEYGSIAKLTQTGGATAADFQGATMMACL